MHTSTSKIIVIEQLIQMHLIVVNSIIEYVSALANDRYLGNIRGVVYLNMNISFK